MDMFSQTQGGGFLFAKAQRFGKSFMLPIAVLANEIKEKMKR